MQSAGVQVDLDSVRVQAAVTPPSDPSQDRTRRLGGALGGGLLVLSLMAAQPWFALIVAAVGGLAALYLGQPYRGMLVADEHGIVIAKQRFSYSRLRVRYVRIDDVEPPYGLLLVTEPGRELRYRVSHGDPASLETWTDVVNRRALTSEAAEIDVEGLDRVRAMLQRDGRASQNSDS